MPGGAAPVYYLFPPPRKSPRLQVPEGVIQPPTGRFRQPFVLRCVTAGGTGGRGCLQRRLTQICVGMVPRSVVLACGPGLAAGSGAPRPVAWLGMLDLPGRSGPRPGVPGTGGSLGGALLRHPPERLEVRLGQAIPSDRFTRPRSTYEDFAPARASHRHHTTTILVSRNRAGPFHVEHQTTILVDSSVTIRIP